MSRTRAYLALGGNVGDVPAAFAAALVRLDGPGVSVAAASSLYETPPMGAAAGGTFLNAAAALDTELAPEPLLDRLQAVENDLGRVRSVRWGPRAVDLDLVFFGESFVDSPRLSLPHPACWFRRFVLDPLAEIASDARHPLTGETVADLWSRLLPRPLPVRFDGPADLAAALAVEFPAVRFAESDAALTLRAGSAAVTPVRREIGLGDGDTLDAARAILTAAVGEPRRVGSLPR